MYDYKGIFYEKEKEKQYFEGGAHFKYSELVYELNKLIKESNKDTQNTSIDSRENIFLSNKNPHIWKEGIKSKSIKNQTKKPNLNFLTINNNNADYGNKINIRKSSKLILKTEKNKEYLQKNKLLGLFSKNSKMSPLKTNPNNNKNVQSIDKNYKNYNLKTIINDRNKKDIFKNISIYLNHNKKFKNNNLPIIKDSHNNNFSNRNIFLSKLNNYKFDTKYEFSNNNLLMKNKVLFSPFKNARSNRENNKILSVDFSLNNKNKNTIDTMNTVTSYKNKLYLHKAKLTKYLKDGMDKMKDKQNINIINFIKNKKNVF